MRVERVEWRPPEPGAEEALARLAHEAEAIARANDEALARLEDAQPLLAGVGVARDLLPEMGERTILHAGPPIDWDDMSGPLRGAVLGAAVHEGLAERPRRGRAAGGVRRVRVRALPRARRGRADGGRRQRLDADVRRRERAHGNRAFCTFNEGLGKVLRYGANDAEVLDRLAWIRDVLARVFGRALQRLGEPIDLRAMTAQALQMGDEGHNRNRAGTSLLLRELLPALIELDEPAADRAAVARFIAGNDHFYLNLTMPASKAIADAAAGIDRSSIVVAMARNGTEFGVRLSGTGDRWFTGPSGMIDGLYLPGFGPEDANPDIGDSTITETVGLGGLRDGRRAGDRARGRRQRRGRARGHAARCTTSRGARAAATRSLRWASAARRPGSTAARSCTRGVLPFVNTGIAHREPGVGQIGAGLVEPPMEAFVKAVRALAGL